MSGGYDGGAPRGGTRGRPTFDPGDVGHFAAAAWRPASPVLFAECLLDNRTRRLYIRLTVVCPVTMYYVYVRACVCVCRRAVVRFTPNSIGPVPLYAPGTLSPLSAIARRLALKAVYTENFRKVGPTTSPVTLLKRRRALAAKCQFPR